MIEDTIADSIRKVVKGFTKEVKLDYVCPGLFEKVYEDNHWNFEYESDTNGWEIDWWVNIMIDKQIIRVSGSMYYGTASIYIM
jgi:hypothetical protein